MRRTITAVWRAACRLVCPAGDDFLHPSFRSCALACPGVPWCALVCPGVPWWDPTAAPPNPHSACSQCPSVPRSLALASSSDPRVCRLRRRCRYVTSRLNRPPVILPLATLVHIIIMPLNRWLLNVQIKYNLTLEYHVRHLTLNCGDKIQTDIINGMQL